MQNQIDKTPSASPTPRSILVVEHETGVADHIRSSLIRFGYNLPPTATSASEALAAVETHRPDLVLMDVHLEEGHDGIAAAAAIHARHPTPIVFLTAHSDDATLIRAQEEAQPHAYLLKPYHDRELRAAVEVALQRHSLEQEVSQQRSLLAGVLSGMSDAVAAADIAGRIVLANEARFRAFGEGLGGDGDRTPSSTHEVFLPDCVTPFPNEQLPIYRALTGESVRDVELFVRSALQPEGRFFSVNATPLLGSDGIIWGAVEVGRDVTELRAARSELQQQSETDALTGTYNRRGFMEVARKALDGARHSGREPALFFIDLNGMKRINDSLGHTEGDRLLMDLTWILRACFRTSDIIGRLGGDEFVVLAPDARNHADVLRERLRTTVDQFNSGGERPYRISVSVGLSTSNPDESASLEALVEQADRRMYEDKAIRGALRAQDPEWLPQLDGESFAPPEAGGPGRQGTPKRVLLVDDDPRNLALLARLLGPLGHELVRAEDGESALSAFDAFKPDLVLLDLVMPGLNGIEVASRIRSKTNADHVPIIILSAHSEQEIRLRGFEAGADDFLEKPPDGRSLRTRVATLLQLKESRDALRQANDELKSRNAELSRLQLEQRELMGFIVHDLKNPLAAVWANLSFARNRVRSDREVSEALEESEVSCRRLRLMINDLLVISRLEESAFPLHNELIVLWDLLRDVFGEYARQAANKRIKLFGPPYTEARVRGDRALLQRVIENILDNSLRHTPENGLVDISTHVNGEIEIAVSNNGPTIPPSDRQRIFEKFARIDTSRTSDNSGIGLYFCKRAIEALGGHISVTETSEWPTSFVVRMPALA